MYGTATETPGETMQKLTIVINGSGGVGKDTLCGMAAGHFRVRNVSSITPVKQIASTCGWNGEKTDRARRFLSDLKNLLVAYNDYPNRCALEEYRSFLASDDEILFVHIREPEEIRKFVDGTGGEAVTLLVRGGKRFRKRRGGYGNDADDRVEQYHYDYVFYNDRPLDQTDAVFFRFLKKMIREQARRQKDDANPAQPASANGSGADSLSSGLDLSEDAQPLSLHDDAGESGTGQ